MYSRKFACVDTKNKGASVKINPVVHGRACVDTEQSLEIVV